MTRNAKKPPNTDPYLPYGADEASGRARRSFAKTARAFLAAVATIALTLGTMAPAAFAESVFASGTGTTDDPYLIRTIDQLEAFRDSVNAGTSYEGERIELAADLDLSGSDWTPIGTGTRSGSGTAAGTAPFKGIFDGGGHTISGLTITSTSGPDYALGFFGVLDGAQVSDLTFANVRIDVPTSELAGAAAGLAINNASLDGIHVSGSVSGASGIGGVLGRMTVSGTITDCTNEATIAGTGGNVGGIVGAAYYTSPSGQMSISGNKNTAAVSGAEAVGGIAGLSAAFVTLNSNSGAICASSYSAGGIVGEQRNYGQIVGNRNDGTITVSSSTGYGCGGIVGWVRYNGNKTAYDASFPLSVIRNSNTGIIEGGNDAGGIVGCLYSAGAVAENTNQAPSISANTFAGGIVGNLQDGDKGALPTMVTEGITVEHNISTTPAADITAENTSLFAYNNDPGKFTVADNSTVIAPDDPTTEPTDPDQSDPSQTPSGDAPSDPTTGPTAGSPTDASATQQAGAAGKTDAADNTSRTGASVQQTSDDLYRVIGVFAVIALTAGATVLFVRKRL